MNAALADGDLDARALSAQRVGEIASAMTWAGFPDSVRHRSRLALRDTLGVMLGGCTTPAALAAASASWMNGGGGPVEIVATGEPSDRIAGAMANAVAASALDFDDGHVLGGSIHPGSAIVPSLLATGAGNGVTVYDLLEALVAAYEVAIRAGFLLWPDDRSHQAHLAGTPAAIGGAIGCAKLLRLPPDGLRRAVEIGWAHAPLARLQFPMVKESLGWAAASAVGSALLAASGFKETSEKDAPAFGSRDHPPTGFDFPGVADEFVASLGTRWEIENTYFKPYASCRFTHAAADAVLDLRSKTRPSTGDIECIIVSTHREAAYLNSQRPTTIEEAQYSFPWVVAAALAEGQVGPVQMNEQHLDDPFFLHLAQRVCVAHDATLDSAYPAAYPARVAVHLVNGETVESQVDVPKGAPSRPMSDAELEAKFMELAEPLIGAHADELSNLIMDGGTEQVDAILQLISLKATNS